MLGNSMMKFVYVNNNRVQIHNIFFLLFIYLLLLYQWKTMFMC